MEDRCKSEMFGYFCTASVLIAIILAFGLNVAYDKYVLLKTIECGFEQVWDDENNTLVWKKTNDTKPE